MKVNKFIKSKIKRNYFFIKGKLKINTEYFINKIEEGIKEDTNLNYKTNLISPITSYKYFMGDEQFYKIIFLLNDMIDKEDLGDDNSYYLADAWGYKSGFGDYTKIHHHSGHIMSGAIMLNKHPQTLYFPEIQEELKPEPGNFVLFSSFLKHVNKRNLSKKIRYGLSFNYMYK